MSLYRVTAPHCMTTVMVRPRPLEESFKEAVCKVAMSQQARRSPKPMAHAMAA
jgi:hypothetical protein